MFLFRSLPLGPSSYDRRPTLGTRRLRRSWLARGGGVTEVRERDERVAEKSYARGRAISLPVSLGDTIAVRPSPALRCEGRNPPLSASRCYFR